MSFLDELNEISKTPEEAVAEKKIESYNDGKKWAISTIDHIKNVIREKAKNGDYETICGKRYMKFYADDLYPSSYLFGKYKKYEYRENVGIFNRQGDYRVRVYYNICDQDYYYGYMDTLNQLFKKENIKSEVVGVFEDSTHKIEFDPLEGIVLERKVFDIDFSIRLKCSIEF